MKQFLILSALFAITLSYPTSLKQVETPEVSILSQFSNNNGLGPYEFSYQSSDGSFREEKATLLDPNDPESPVVIKGSYGYTAPDGVKYVFQYVADQNGYHVDRVQ